MKKELINDDRLTPTMDVLHSGPTQIFRERNNDDNSFISLRNADVVLKHPTNKSMRAELVDGEWYWVTKCQECLGLPRNTARSYIECDKHDRCSICSTNRKHIKGVVWGGVRGWTCKPCKEKEDELRRTNAFEALGGNEPDCLNVDEIICAHCGSNIHDTEMYESGNIDCYVCGGENFVEVEYTRHYSSSVVGLKQTSHE